MDTMITFLSPTKGRRPRSLGSDQYSEAAMVPSPEIHRWAILLMLKLLAPSTMRFLATETPLPKIMGIWYPIILSYYMLQRHESQRLSIQARANEQRLWLHYWSMIASWQFFRRSIINPALQSTFGFFFLIPWKVKQTLLSSLAQLELCACLLLIYPIIYSKTWDGTIRLTTTNWNQSSCVYRVWERYVLSKIVTRETTLSLLSHALFNFSSGSSSAMEDDRVGASSPGTPSSAADEKPKQDASNGEETSYWTYMEMIMEKTYNLATQMISIAQWFGFLSDDTVSSAKALWAKARRVPAGLVLPPLVLAIMPTNFCAELGLHYLQWIYTASLTLKAASQHGSNEMVSSSDEDDGKIISTRFSHYRGEGNDETYWLQYWIIHTMVVFGGLDYVSSQLPYWFKGLVLWNFWLTLAWIWLLHDSRVVPSMFDVLAAELVGLGLVPDPVDSDTIRYRPLHGQDSRPRAANISQTNTARFAQYILKQLPRAGTSPSTKRDNVITVVGEQNVGVDAREERSGDQYPDLVAASSSLSSESSVSASPSSSQVASGERSSDREGRSAWTSPSSASDHSTHGVITRTKERRKKLLLRYRQHRSRQSSPVNSSTSS